MSKKPSCTNGDKVMKVLSEKPLTLLCPDTAIWKCGVQVGKQNMQHEALESVLWREIAYHGHNLCEWVGCVSERWSVGSWWQCQETSRTNGEGTFLKPYKTAFKKTMLISIDLILTKKQSPWQGCCQFTFNRNFKFSSPTDDRTFILKKGLDSFKNILNVQILNKIWEFESELTPSVHHTAVDMSNILFCDWLSLPGTTWSQRNSMNSMKIKVQTPPTWHNQAGENKRVQIFFNFTLSKRIIKLKQRDRFSG